MIPDVIEIEKAPSALEAAYAAADQLNELAQKAAAAKFDAMYRMFGAAALARRYPAADVAAYEQDQVDNWISKAADAWEAKTIADAARAALAEATDKENGND